MKDILHTKHKGCGGTFKEINIWEDIECDKCGETSDRYIYTKAEKRSRLEAENKRLQERVEFLENKLEAIVSIAGGA